MRKYERAIVFTKVPLNGYYRYKDIFQIFPAAFTDMPDNPYKRHYPNILEFWFTDEEKIDRETEYENLKELMSITATTVTKRDKIISLLNSFTNNSFFLYNNFDGVWAMPILFNEETKEISEEVNFLSAQWCSEGFHFPTLAAQLQITEFTRLELKEVEKKQHRLFYLSYPSLDSDRTIPIVFPSSFDTILDSYFALEKEILFIVDSAIAYNAAAIELLSKKRTLALLASFTAMETMVNLEYRDIEAEKCEKCGQLKFSVSKKFREYLLKYIGHSTENKKKFNSYYSLRSKIVHTGMRLKAEVLFSEFPRTELDDEFITRVAILQLGKMAIANWLIMNSKVRNA
jgi:hypothetical protein